MDYMHHHGVQLNHNYQLIDFNSKIPPFCTHSELYYVAMYILLHRSRSTDDSLMYGTQTARRDRRRGKNW